MHDQIWLFITNNDSYTRGSAGRSDPTVVAPADAEVAVPEGRLSSRVLETTLSIILACIPFS